jgi:hypothetical protein
MIKSKTKRKQVLQVFEKCFRLQIRWLYRILKWTLNELLIKKKRQVEILNKIGTHWEVISIVQGEGQRKAPVVRAKAVIIKKWWWAWKKSLRKKSKENRTWCTEKIRIRAMVLHLSMWNRPLKKPRALTKNPNPFIKESNLGTSRSNTR